MLFDGYIRLKVKTDSFFTFIRNCQKKGIYLYNVKKNNDIYYFDIKAKEHQNMLDVADECKITPIVCGKFGLKMKVLMYKSRKAFLIIFFLMTIFYGLKSCYISEICISGNEIFADCQILECLKENGLYVGRLKFGINPEIFQNEVIKDFPELSWIWVRIDGTKAIVDVREKVSLPNFFDYTDYGNVVAAKDGVIKSAIASGGTLLVSEGMFVKKGDILISGIYDSNKNAPVRFVNADGKILAVTSYYAKDDFDCTITKYSVKNEPKDVYSVKLFGIKLWSGKVDKSKSNAMSKQELKYRIFGKNYLPLAFTKTKYCEIIKENVTLSEEEAKELAYEKLIKKLKLDLTEGAEIVDIKKETSQNSDGTFKACVSITCIENIAAKQPIVVED